MTIVPDDTHLISCRRCKNDDLEKMLISGPGDWLRSIVCLKCYTVRNNASIETLAQALEEVYGISRDTVMSYLWKQERES